ncbi:MAG: hypothetical protein ABI461_21195 [Polyangiaceae bacterium]
MTTKISVLALAAATLFAAACGGTSTQPQNPSVTAAEGLPSAPSSTNDSNSAIGPTPKAIDGPEPPATDGMTPSSK